MRFPTDQYVPHKVLHHFQDKVGRFFRTLPVFVHPLMMILAGEFSLSD